MELLALHTLTSKECYCLIYIMNYILYFIFRKFIYIYDLRYLNKKNVIKCMHFHSKRAPSIKFEIRKADFMLCVTRNLNKTVDRKTQNPWRESKAHMGCRRYQPKMARSRNHRRTEHLQMLPWN